ncbi:sulfotransferase [bacterium]|nr:sulfotransferase [bacterium]
MEFKTGEIESYLLHLVRDGRAVMSSYLRRNSTMTVAGFSDLWLTRIKRERALYGRFPTARKLRARYEEIVTQPQETLQSLCQWLGLDYSPEMLNYWQYDHHMVSGNTGTRSLIWKYRGDDWQSGQAKKRYYSEEAGFKISLDQRWQRELSSVQIEEFRRLTDPYYQDFEWNVT